MPTYTYRCHRCKNEWDEFRLVADCENARCQSCVRDSTVSIVVKPRALSVFRPTTFEHIGSEPIHCETADDLRRACEEHQCYSPALENGLHKGSIGRLKEV